MFDWVQFVAENTVSLYLFFRGYLHAVPFGCLVLAVLLAILLNYLVIRRAKQNEQKTKIQGRENVGYENTES